MNVNELKNIVKDVIVESSLSRVFQHISQHDCATITAFRNDPSDHANCVDGHDAPSTFQKEGLSPHEINMRNNKFLKAALLSKGFGVTPVDGTYVENFKSDDPEKPPIEVKEDSFFVVNLPDVSQEEFFGVITQLGKKYCQDSVLLIPKGGQQGATLYGTNNSFPGLDVELNYEKLSYGKDYEFMSKVRNRPFAAINEIQTYNKLSRLERMAVKEMARKVFNG
jgi:hypothetical protein